VPAALAQSPKSVVSGLQENQDLIGQCRRLNQTAEVFNNTNLWPRDTSLVTLSAGTEVSLTGVVLPGRAQIFLRNNFNGLSSIQPVGWINANFLTPCNSGTQAGRACFRANVRLEVRSTPSSSGPLIYLYQVGETVYTTTNPPTRQHPASAPSWFQVITPREEIGWAIETIPNSPVPVTQIDCP
jgi:hypothetical protein